MRRRALRWLILPVLLVAVMVSTDRVVAAFTATTTNVGNTFTAAASFPTYPTAVTGDGAAILHRSDEAPSSSATSAAADSAGTSQPGVYNGKTNGPSTHWRFDEGTGSTAADHSGAANPGTLSGTGATWTSFGRAGNALTFNGSTGYVAGTGPAVTTTTSFTVSAWVYVTAVPTWNKVIVSQNGTTVSAFVLLLGSDGKWGWSLPRTDTASPTYDWVTSAGTVALSTWTHVVGVYDSAAAAGQQLKLYVNAGTPVVTGHTSTWNATGALQVGRSLYSSDYGDYFNGRIDEVSTHRRALSATDITDLYNGVAPAPMTAGVPGALQGAQQGQQSSTAVAFNGTTNAYSTLVAAPGPADFTTECWFKTTSATGGQLIGYTADATGLASTGRDRMVYLDSGNRLTFGIWWNNAPRVIRSPAGTTYNDGGWHHVATSYGPAGLKLYVDGVLVASDTDYTQSANPAGTFAGYWRWGGGQLNWANTNTPVDDYLTGTIDEVSITNSQLTDQQIAWHYHANH
ncbi:MAG TPA: LamG domain-containing protein [Actinoplanes sp.]